jgi:hypothetical protein
LDKKPVTKGKYDYIFNKSGIKGFTVNKIYTVIELCRQDGSNKQMAYVKNDQNHLVWIEFSYFKKKIDKTNYQRRI